MWTENTISVHTMYFLTTRSIFCPHNIFLEIERSQMYLQEHQPLILRDRWHFPIFCPHSIFSVHIVYFLSTCIIIVWVLIETVFNVHRFIRRGWCSWFYENSHFLSTQCIFSPHFDFLSTWSIFCPHTVFLSIPCFLKLNGRPKCNCRRINLLFDWWHFPIFCPHSIFRVFLSA